jgi:hypothetical protein
VTDCLPGLWHGPFALLTSKPIPRGCARISSFFVKEFNVKRARPLCTIWMLTIRCFAWHCLAESWFTGRDGVNTLGIFYAVSTFLFNHWLLCDLVTMLYHFCCLSVDCFQVRYWYYSCELSLLSFTAVVLFEFACSVRCDDNTERKTISSEKKLSVMWDMTETWGACVSLVKQIKFSVLGLNIVVRNHYIIEENQNQWYKIIFLRNYQVIVLKNTLFILCSCFRSVEQIILTCIL